MILKYEKILIDEGNFVRIGTKKIVFLFLSLNRG